MLYSLGTRTETEQKNALNDPQEHASLQRQKRVRDEVRTPYAVPEAYEVPSTEYVRSTQCRKRTKNPYEVPS